MLLRAKSFSRNRVAGMVGLVVIMTILLSFTMWFRAIQHRFTFAYAETSFDFLVQGFSESQIIDIQQLAFVDAVFPVRILGGEIRSRGRSLHVDIYASQSFKNREISYFNERLFIRKDDRILTTPDVNPIVIDLRVARAFDVNLGDVLLIPFGKDRTEVRFTVATISEPMLMPSVLILWQGEQRQVFRSDFGKDPIYSFMFVKTPDKAVAREYFLREFIPWQEVNDGLLDLRDMSSIYDFNQRALIERVTRLQNLRYELRYTPPIVMVTSVLGFLAYLLFLLRETNKKAYIHSKDISIFFSLGLPRAYFTYFLMLDTMLFHSPSLAIAALGTKYLVYDFLMQSYLPWYLFLWYCLGAFALQLAAVIISGLIMYIRLSLTNTAALLAKE